MSTVIGIAAGTIAVFVGMVIKGAPISALVNPAAFLIIIVGTIGAVMNALPMDVVKRTPVLLKKIFNKQEIMTIPELVDIFVDYSQLARREGLLALEGRIDSITDPFLKSGMQMMIDGLDGEFIRDVLEADISTREERHRQGALVFSQGGMYAPTLGVLGAVIGLIAALGNLSDIDQLGASIAAAFVATMLGIFFGYVICHPFANKLKVISQKEMAVKRVMIEGILSLQAGDAPMAVEAKLKAFMPQSERANVKTAD